MEVYGHAWNEVRALAAGPAKTGGIAAALHIDRDASKVLEDRVELPITKNLVPDHTEVLKGRQGVDGVSNESMPAIEVSVTSVQVQIERISRGIGEGDQWNIGDSMRP